MSLSKPRLVVAPSRSGAARQLRSVFGGDVDPSFDVTVHEIAQAMWALRVARRLVRRRHRRLQRLLEGQIAR